jgi:hypothetical protein
MSMVNVPEYFKEELYDKLKDAFRSANIGFYESDVKLLADYAAEICESSIKYAYEEGFYKGKLVGYKLKCSNKLGVDI